MTLEETQQLVPGKEYILTTTDCPALRAKYEVIFGYVNTNGDVYYSRQENFHSGKFDWHTWLPLEKINSMEPKDIPRYTYKELY